MSVVIEHEGVSAEVNPENGQLVSLVKQDLEFFHEGGRQGYNGPGWQNSEIVCFPVFGPVSDSEVMIGSFRYPLEQHGISRYAEENPFKISKVEGDSVVLVQEYNGQDIRNPRFKSEPGRPEHLNWLDYTLLKRFSVSEKGLECNLGLKNTSEFVMPYMIGWHPSFKVQGEIRNGEFFNRAGDLITGLKDLTGRAGSVVAKDCDCVSYWDFNSKKGVTVSSNELNNFVLWSPGPSSGMFCIEPVSQLPNIRNPSYFGNFRGSGDFEILAPGDSKEYSVNVELLNER